MKLTCSNQGILFVLAVAWLSGIVAAQENPKDYPLKTKLAEASEEGQQALSAFQIKKGWTAELWAAEPMVGNPVVFTIDNQGRIFVCESYRQATCVTDNRDHDRTWVDRDLAAKTVEDRIAYHKELLPEKGIEYTKFDDLLRVLEDTNGDGKADKQTVWADTFNDLEMGTGAGVLVNGKDVYYTCIPDLWLLNDTDDDGKSDTRRSLSTGYGVKVAFRGHDSHGLIVGPDGLLYFSIGDRGYHITTAEGNKLHDPVSGAVFRCEMDGSNLEVVATGLRNPQELAFDEFGNLFTGDNNSDGGDKARWVYVAEGGDTGWRMYYQYMSDRGPFSREKIWHPYHKEQPAFIVPPIANFADGPSGLAYYPGTGLSEEYDGRFFLCDFRGASAVSGVRTFKSKSEGAFYKLTDEEQPIWRMLVTDLQFGPDGWIYVSDWVNGWVGENKGRIYRFSDPDHVDSEIVKQVRTMLRDGLGEKETADLIELMNHRDQRVRQMAQFEIVHRKLDTELQNLASDNKAPLLARLHAMWGIGQRLRVDKNNQLAALIAKLMGDSTSEVRAQAAKLVGDHKINVGGDGLIYLLSDADLRVRYFAAISLGKVPNIKSIIPLIKMLEENDGQDPGLRHAGIMGLAGHVKQWENPIFAIAERHKSIEVRRAIVVALRKAKSNAAYKFLRIEKDTLVLDEVARAIYDIESPNPYSLKALASRLDPALSDSEPFLFRALGACNHIGGIENAKRIAQFASSPSQPKKLRVDAIKLLANWANPASRDYVIGAWRPIGKRDSSDGIAVLTPVFESLAEAQPTRSAAIQAARTLKMAAAEPTLTKIFLNQENKGSERKAALSALSRIGSDNIADLTSKATADVSPELRMAALEVSVDQNLPIIADASFWNRGLTAEEMNERQHAYKTLSTESLIGNQGVAQVVTSQLDKLIADSIPETDRVDLVATAEAWSSNPDVAIKLAKYRESFDQKDPVSKFRDSLVGGNEERGEEIFWNLGTVYCQRCHQIGKRGGAVGPNLSDIALKKDRSYLLESIVDTNRTIAENFETTVILDLDGNLISGIVQEETEEYIKLIDGDAKVTKILKEDIEGRRKGKSGMPADLYKSLTPSEIRDLVEFLANQKTAPDKGTVIPEGHK